MWDGVTGGKGSFVKPPEASGASAGSESTCGIMEDCCNIDVADQTNMAELRGELFLGGAPAIRKVRVFEYIPASARRQLRLQAAFSFDAIFSLSPLIKHSVNNANPNMTHTKTEQ